MNNSLKSDKSSVKRKAVLPQSLDDFPIDESSVSEEELKNEDMSKEELIHEKDYKSFVEQNMDYEVLREMDSTERIESNLNSDIDSEFDTEELKNLVKTSVGNFYAGYIQRVHPEQINEYVENVAADKLISFCKVILKKLSNII